MSSFICMCVHVSMNVCMYESIYVCTWLNVNVVYVFRHADPTNKLVASAVAKDIYSPGKETGDDYPKYVTKVYSLKHS